VGAWIERGRIGWARIEKAWIVRAPIERARIKRVRIERARIESVRIERARIERAWIERAWIERARIESVDRESVDRVLPLHMYRIRAGRSPRLGAPRPTAEVGGARRRGEAIGTTGGAGRPGCGAGRRHREGGAGRVGFLSGKAPRCSGILVWEISQFSISTSWICLLKDRIQRK
jgi:hypothetical protein